jgi:predicted transcriptional regulator
LRILETDWGKWRPRTIDELDEALKANGIEQSPRTLTGVLMELVKKEKIKRWNTNAGYVYILAETEALHQKR